MVNVGTALVPNFTALSQRLPWSQGPEPSVATTFSSP